jgi:hypothetical protein
VLIQALVFAHISWDFYNAHAGFANLRNSPKQELAASTDRDEPISCG